MAMEKSGMAAASGMKKKKPATYKMGSGKKK